MEFVECEQKTFDLQSLKDVVKDLQRANFSTLFCEIVANERRTEKLFACVENTFRAA